EQLAEVKDAFVASLLSAKVTSINLAGCNGITDDSIKAIALNCPSLESLEVRGCVALTHESIKLIPARCFVPESLREAWSKHKHNIVSEDATTIDFGACWDSRNGWTYKYFTEEQLAEVTNAFVVSLLSPKVTSISLTGCTGITTDVCVKAIAANCTALKALNVDGCGALTDESIKTIPARCLVPESLREAWAEHRNNIVSEDGTKIDFGVYYAPGEGMTYKYFAEAQLE
ncbi:MAG: hypothetical protein AAFV01_17510, partial [Bacteroidota bacterium]